MRKKYKKFPTHVAMINELNLMELTPLNILIKLVGINGIILA
jgi:hypothetical protein